MKYLYVQLDVSYLFILQVVIELDESQLGQQLSFIECYCLRLFGKMSLKMVFLF